MIDADRNGRAALWHAHGASAALAIGFAQLVACAEQEVWTGRRCPGGQLVCAVDAGRLRSSDLDRDAQPTSDAPVTDACRDCEPDDASATTLRTRCIPGKYEGRMEGSYTPAAAGACGLFTLFDGSGGGFLRFSIGDSDGSLTAPVGASDCDLGWVEDPDASAEEGGSSEAGMPPIVRFTRGLLLGSIDCTTGRLSAEFKGVYRTISLCTLGVLENDYYYLGKMEAVFDPAIRGFDGGVLRMREPPALLGPAPGGEVHFSVTRVGESGPLDGPSTDCFYGETFPIDDFPDAGP